MNLSGAAKLDDVSKQNGSYSRRDERNGNRPSPLKINRESFLIQKPCSNSSSFARMAPVIIYTQSPKIIHTQPRDFMALVQKLTGHHRDHHHEIDKTMMSTNTTSSVISSRSHDDYDSSNSILTDDQNNYEKNGGAGDHDHHHHDHVQAALSSSPTPTPNMFSQLQQLSNPYFGDIPLFTPTSTSAYRYSNSTSQYASSPNVAGSFSPSLFEFIKY